MCLPLSFKIEIFDEKTDRKKVYRSMGKVFDRVLTSLDEFIHRQTTSGVLLASVLAGVSGFNLAVFTSEKSE